MRPYMKDDKIYPGEMRIINALYKEPLTFTELIEKAQINRVTLSDYIKRLLKKDIIKHDKTNGKYSFPMIFQPLFKSSFPDQEYIESIDKLIELSEMAKGIYVKNDKTNVYANKYRLETFFYCFLSDVLFALNEAGQYRDSLLAQEFIQGFSERRLIPRLKLFILEAFEHQDAYEQFAKNTTSKLRAEAKQLLDALSDLRKAGTNSG